MEKSWMLPYGSLVLEQKNRPGLEIGQLLPQFELVFTHYLIQWKQS